MSDVQKSLNVKCVDILRRADQFVEVRVHELMLCVCVCAVRVTVTVRSDDDG